MLFLLSFAHAANYNVEFCAKFQVNYSDALSTTGDDEFTSNSEKTAKGVKVKVKNNTTGAYVFNGYTSTSSSNPGCTGTLVLNNAYRYTVTIHADTYRNSNYVKVKNDLASNAIWYSTVYSSYLPTASGTVNIVTGSHQAWNIAAAAGQALGSHNGGLTGETYTFYSDDPVNTGNSTPGSYDGDIAYIANDTYKYVTAHEMGHMIAMKADPGTGLNSSYAATDAGDPCLDENDDPGHPYNSKEYSSGAANEGFASYFGATAFNTEEEGDCFYYVHYNVDWDNDGNTAEEPRVMSCEFGVDRNSDGDFDDATDVDGADYMGDTCTGTSANRGTQYDWLRFFWDLVDDSTISFADTLDLLVEADHDSWNSTDVGAAADDPWARLEDGALVLGIDAELATWGSYNGVDH